MEKVVDVSAYGRRERIFGLFAGKKIAGSQPKWHIGHMYYKADDIGFEGLAETIVSDMAKKSNIALAAEYNPVLIKTEKGIVSGCESPNFLEKGKALIDTGALLSKHQIELKESFMNADAAIPEYISTIESLTGIEDFGVYYAKLAALDAITLNEDRHLANLAIIKQGTEYETAPIFDNGRSFTLASCAWDSKNIESLNVDEAIEKASSRLYFASYEHIRRAAERVAGGPKLIISYGPADLEATLHRCEGVYSENVLARAKTIVSLQMDKHLEYFRGEAWDKTNQIAERLLVSTNSGICLQRDEDNRLFAVVPEREDLKVRIEKDFSLVPIYRGNPVDLVDVLSIHPKSFENMHRMYEALASAREIKGRQLEHALAR